MGTISVSLPADGTTADVQDYNTPITTIVTAVNGGLDNANIATGAAIDGAKLANLVVDKSQLATDANPYKFSVYRNAAWNWANSSWAKIQFDTEIFDTNNNYDAATNFRYVAPVAGFYYFSAVASLVGVGGNLYQVALYRNGTVAKYGQGQIQGAGTSILATGVDGLVQLAANDYVEIFDYGTNTAGSVGSAFTYFDGFLVSRT